MSLSVVPIEQGDVLAKAFDRVHDDLLNDLGRLKGFFLVAVDDTGLSAFRYMVDDDQASLTLLGGLVEAQQTLLQDRGGLGAEE